ncbi:tyrosine-type recombinase/integrase [Nitrospirillum iridis]|uniref:Integrase n=1 Tax=Nitrospirillum iridis TaxID=765888 RepID=A0A7X0AYF8_9PROT|nr:tyrosine-type recombinase/integrase [Nitrospirillum iridis]MBB6251395.1 integrase [Nitrospirillum iridis]
MVEFRLRDGTGTVKLKYLVEDVDRHGKVRIYLRRRGHLKVLLTATPGTPEFMAQYRAALEGKAPERAPRRKGKPAPGETAAAPGTFRALVERYYATGAFRNQLDPGTQKARRYLLDALCEKYGKNPAHLMTSTHVQKLHDDRSDTPEGANNLLKALKHLFRVAVKAGWLQTNPARDVQKFPQEGEGYHTWTLEEVAQFEAKHPIGTRARLAMALLLYTGQRRSDVVRMGPQHVKDGWLTITQAKGARHKPVTVSIPIVAPLREILDQTNTGHLAYLVTMRGKPFAVASFGNMFRDWCREAGLDHCSAHGLRKTAATRLAELGASEHEIAAITGHRTLSQVAHYTRAARQKGLAARAMERLEEHGSNKSVQPSEAGSKRLDKSSR